MIDSRHRLTSTAALALGLVLLVIALRHTDLEALWDFIASIWPAVPLLLLPGAAWHIVRTAAWRRCFPADVRPGFLATLRVRLAAEALSYVTISGVAGEPLKVLLLAPSIPPVAATSAVALERLAYLTVTAAMLGIGALVALVTMPLAPVWSRIFGWIAGGAIGFAALCVALFARGRRRQVAPASVAPDGPTPSRLRRFARELARQFSLFARSNPRTIAALVALEVAAFFTMVAEVYVVLAVTAHPISLAGAMTVETFTRVASLVTAFIPANIGALEASNIAAANAIRVAEGGLALALVRRFRGLLFCALGFLVYPRIGGRSATRTTSNRGGRTLAAIQHGDSDVLVSQPLAGLPVAERIARAAVRVGYSRLMVWTQRETEWTRLITRAGLPISIAATDDPARWQQLLDTLGPAESIDVLAPGVVPSPQLLRTAQSITVTGARRTPVPASANHPQSGVFRATVADLRSPDALADTLERESAGAVPPIDDIRNGSAWLSLSMRTPEDLAVSEQRLRDSIIKPTDGVLGTFNRRFSIPISIALIRSCRLNANLMSVVIIALSVYAGWLFSRGTYATAVAAALVSWAASVLDGTDGELARLQYTESALGCWVDTLGDYLYYLAIFAGLTVGAARQTGWSILWWCGAALGAGVLLTMTLLIVLRWRTTGGRPERLRTQTKAHFDNTGKRWARIVARLSTCATRATMPYGILALVLLGLAPVVVLLATIGAQIYWIVLAKELGGLLRTNPETSPKKTEARKVAGTISPGHLAGPVPPTC